MSKGINNAVISKATLPALERRGLDVQAFRVLKSAIHPNAKSDESVLMAFDYCKARNLDPFKRVVHIVPIWDSKQRMLVDTVWPGIAELRTTAIRTKQYAGKDSPVFGKTITKKWGDIEVEFPEYCQITLYRMVDGQRVAFECTPVYWLESFGLDKKTNTPNKMWKTRPIGQLAKCAEAAALRETFPEELGGDYCAEEMQDKTMGGANEREARKSEMMSCYADAVDVTPDDAYKDGDSLPPPQEVTPPPVAPDAYKDEDFAPSVPPVSPQETDVPPAPETKEVQE